MAFSLKPWFTKKSRFAEGHLCSGACSPGVVGIVVFVVRASVSRKNGCKFSCIVVDLMGGYVRMVVVVVIVLRMLCCCVSCGSMWRLGNVVHAVIEGRDIVSVKKMWRVCDCS